jgi:hypothetical protein
MRYTVTHCIRYTETHGIRYAESHGIRYAEMHAIRHAETHGIRYAETHFYTICGDGGRYTIGPLPLLGPARTQTHRGLKSARPRTQPALELGVRS